MTLLQLPEIPAQPAAVPTPPSAPPPAASDSRRKKTLVHVQVEKEKSSEASTPATPALMSGGDGRFAITGSCSPRGRSNSLCAPAIRARAASSFFGVQASLGESLGTTAAASPRPLLRQASRLRRGSFTGGLPMANPPSAEPESSRTKKRDVDTILNDVMRAYMNLELSGIGDDELTKVAAALRNNSSVTSVNLSFCTGINDSGVESLGLALRDNIAVAVLNLSGCSSISDGNATASDTRHYDCDHVQG